MRHFLLAALVASLATPAYAGEEYLGAIVSGAGADTTNGSTAAPFVIPLGSKLTLYCTAAANICTDTTTACGVTGAANMGVPVASTSAFPTSVRPLSSAPSITISGQRSSIVRIVGAAAVTCYVFARNGNE